MKMAKATEQDLAAAHSLSEILDNLERGYMPDADDDRDEPFSIDDADQCQRVLHCMLKAVGGSSIFRVTFGMSVVCDPRNKVLDPTADTLELHPDHIANALDAKRYRALHWMAADVDRLQAVMKACSSRAMETYTPENLHALADAAIAAQQGKGGEA